MHTGATFNMCLALLPQPLHAPPSYAAAASMLCVLNGTMVCTITCLSPVAPQPLGRGPCRKCIIYPHNQVKVEIMCF